MIDENSLDFALSKHICSDHKPCRIGAAHLIRYYEEAKATTTVQPDDKPDPLILASQVVLDAMETLKAGRPWGPWNSHVMDKLRQEMRIFLRRKAPERESINEDDLAAFLSVNNFVYNEEADRCASELLEHFNITHIEAALSGS